MKMIVHFFLILTSICLFLNDFIKSHCMKISVSFPPKVDTASDFSLLWITDSHGIVFVSQSHDSLTMNSNKRTLFRHLPSPEPSRGLKKQPPPPIKNVPPSFLPTTLLTKFTEPVHFFYDLCFTSICLNAHLFLNRLYTKDMHFIAAYPHWLFYSVLQC